MIRYAVGICIVTAGLIAGNIAADPSLLSSPPAALTALWLNGCILPTLCGVGVALTLHTLRPRRIFAPQAALIAPLSLGFLVGALSVGAMILLVARFALDRQVSDGLLFSGAATACALITVPWTRRRPVGVCRECGYDIQASLDAGRCPACGNAI